jgi:hypothetical protein
MPHHRVRSREAVDVWRHGCGMTSGRPRLAISGGGGAISPAKVPRDSAIASFPHSAVRHLIPCQPNMGSLGDRNLQHGRIRVAKAEAG